MKNPITSAKNLVQKHSTTLKIASGATLGVVATYVVMTNSSTPYVCTLTQEQIQELLKAPMEMSVRYDFARHAPIFVTATS